MITIHNCDQRTPEWYALRLGRFTASEAGDLMAGESTAAFQGLIHSKAFERLTGCRADEVYVNEHMRYGIERESEARMWYMLETGLDVKEVGFVTRDDFPMTGVSPDGIIAGDGIAIQKLLEIKAPSPRQHMETLAGRKVPSRYRWQLQMQAWLCDSPRVDFVSYRHETGGVILSVERNDSDVDALVKRVTLAEQMVQDLVNKAKGASK